jgi:hypothetical protein
MPQLETVYDLKCYHTQEELKDWMVRANAYGFVTRNQGKAILQKLTPMLPVDASMTVRTNKSTIYMLANESRFRVNQRAQIDDRPWNPNPRRAPRNPWAD